MNTCYRLDLAALNKTWDSFQSLPLEVAYPALAFVPAVNRLYAIGGEMGVFRYNKRVMVHDFSTGTWSFTGIEFFFLFFCFVNLYLEFFSAFEAVFR